MQAPEEEEKVAKFVWEDGSTYEGGWSAVPDPAAEPVEAAEGEEAPAAAEKKVRHGTGTFATGDYTYDGDWVEDKMEGVGTFTFAGGATYEGEWVADRYHGLGKYTGADGSSYEGQWSEGKMHGQGTFVNAKGQKFAGQFFNGNGPGLTLVLD